MNKAELLQLLRDPDICKEIFEIVKKGGKPVVEAPKFTSIGDKLKHMYPNAVATQQPTPQPSQQPTPQPSQQPTPPTFSAKPSQPPKLVVDPAKIPPNQSVQANLSSIAD